MDKHPGTQPPPRKKHCSPKQGDLMPLNSTAPFDEVAYQLAAIAAAQTQSPCELGSWQMRMHSTPGKGSLQSQAQGGKHL